MASSIHAFRRSWRNLRKFSQNSAEVMKIENTPISYLHLCKKVPFEASRAKQDVCHTQWFTRQRAAMERRLCYSCPFLHAHRPLQYIFALNVQIMCAKEATHLSTFKVLNSSLRNCRRPTPNGNEPWIDGATLEKYRRLFGRSAKKVWLKKTNPRFHAIS